MSIPSRPLFRGWGQLPLYCILLKDPLVLLSHFILGIFTPVPLVTSTTVPSPLFESLVQVAHFWFP